ncbi:hypothetical protein PUN28_005929 [Cardiocondyla obscurior]|uniref:Uncharacterized protein n=1 Tax=Cardiocondyla obscurior TaxID=286306 RepID=A0AAW2G8H9_9HYME
MYARPYARTQAPTHARNACGEVVRYLLFIRGRVHLNVKRHSRCRRERKREYHVLPTSPSPAVTRPYTSLLVLPRPESHPVSSHPTEEYHKGRARQSAVIEDSYLYWRNTAYLRK